MALISKRNTSSSSAVQRQQKIQVNPYEIQENVLEMIGKIAAQNKSEAINLFWNKIYDFVFHRENNFFDYFYNNRGGFQNKDFYEDLMSKLRTFAWNLESNVNSTFTQVAVAGGFSAGKSSFLNRLTGYAGLLPTGTEPTSVVLTYLRCKGDTEQVTVYGENAKGALFELDKDILDGIRHGSSSHYHFASVLNKLIVDVPASPNTNGLAFVDTPGYNNTESANAVNGVSDLDTALEGIEGSQVLIWLVDITKGTLRKEDIEIIESFKGAKLIVFSKADEKRNECQHIVTEAYKQLVEEGNEGEFIDFLAYSSLDNKILYSYKNFRTLNDILDEIKKQGVGLSTVVNDILAMFDAEIENSNEKAQKFAESYKESNNNANEFTKAIRNDRENTEENKKWVREIMSSYGMAIERGDQFLNVSEKLGQTLNEALTAVYNYNYGRFSPSSDLYGIIDKYEARMKSCSALYNKANNISGTIWNEEGRKDFIGLMSAYMDWYLKEREKSFENAKEEAQSDLRIKENYEKFHSSMKTFVDDLGVAIDEGYEAFNEARNRGTNKVSLNSDNSNAKDVFSAIDTDDIKQFTKCFVKPVDMSVCNPSGYSPLTYAVESGNNDMVKFLLDCGADPNAYDNRGYNAFHTAVENEYKDMCEMLLKDSPDLIDSKTRNGESVEDLLEKQTFKKWIKNKL